MKGENEMNQREEGCATGEAIQMVRAVQNEVRLDDGWSRPFWRIKLRRVGKKSLPSLFINLQIHILLLKSLNGRLVRRSASRLPFRQSASREQQPSD